MKRISILLALAVLLTACSQTPTPPQQTEPTVDTLQQALSQTEDTAVYEMTLTEEQTAAYDNGHFLLLEHLGGDVYRPFYTSKNVTLDGQTLRANFNGKVPYMTNDLGQCALPFITEGKTQDGKTPYMIKMVTANYVDDGWGETICMTEYNDLYVVYDRAEGTLCNMKLVADGEEPEDLFVQSQLQLPQPAMYSLNGGVYYHVAKDAAGKPLPTENWTKAGVNYADWGGAAGLQPAYGRLAQITEPYPVYDVYMLLVARDGLLQETLSELMPVSVLSAPMVKQVKPEPTALQWDSGNKLLLMQEQDITLYLTKTSYGGIISYEFQMKNDTWQDLDVQISNVVVNDRILLEDMEFLTEAGAWGKSLYPLRFPAAAIADGLDRVESLQFTLTVTEPFEKAALKEETLHITLTGNASLKAYYYDDLGVGQPQTQEPACGFQLTEPQQLEEQKGVKLTVLGVGSDQKDAGLCCLIKVENTTEEWRYVNLRGVVVNGICLDWEKPLALPAGKTAYVDCMMEAELPVMQIGTLSLGVSVAEGKVPIQYALPPLQWYSVAGQITASQPDTLPEGELLLEEQGLRVFFLEQTADYADRPVWRLLVKNDGAQTLLLKPWEELLDGATPDNFLEGLLPEYNDIVFYDNLVPAGQSAILEVHADGSEDVSFRIQATNEQNSSILFTTEGRVQLKAA